ncbi:YciI family protein [Sphingomonas sp. 1P06PA]|uniref:YciI family protein n=1 Tax=Sphingomonas sp. 1P06PA TaxID=554121 RepID=UPI0039A5ECBF
MPKYLISFPGEAMLLAEEDYPAVSAAAHAVIEEAKAAGVYVFAGGIHEQVDPVLVAGDGSVEAGTYPGVRLTGGFTILELPARADAIEWARRIAVACRCAEELREFMIDPAS